MIKLSTYRKAVKTNRKAYDLMNTPGTMNTKQVREMNRAIDESNDAAHELFAEFGIRKDTLDSPAKYEKQARILASVNRASGVDWKA